MSQSAGLIFADAVRPERIREFVLSLGGERSPDPAEPNDTSLARAGGLVWVYPYPVGDLPYGPELLAAYAAALGAPPRSRVILDVSRAPESEWLAAEIVLAAAERWRFVIDDFGEQIITVGEFTRRFAKRPGQFFQPEGRYDPSPSAMRRARVTVVTLVLPGAVRREALGALVRSPGARMRPDDGTDAEVTRGGAHVWMHLHDPGAVPGEATGPAHRRLLGDPPYGSAVLEVFEGEPSQALALEVVEAAAGHWPVLVHGPSGQVMEIEELRERAAGGAEPLFDP